MCNSSSERVLMSSKSNSTWQQICSSALNEPDPRKALALLEAALCKLEKRFAEWGNDQGTEEELANILRNIQALRERTAQFTAQLQKERARIGE
jgi:hypothetical protein